MIDEVKQFQGLEPKHLKFNNNEVSKLNDLIINCISQTENLIINYTNDTTLSTNTPPE
ncbi:hypothetical protein [uncultured Methanobrevibacter sp.]|uniref:hypothetical protein n=1 Tax=uncultured Methanobrevibacter sp. TaxID=253161 RepID=UPI0025FC2A51|nr:hypothetical protein [uncultured Methanobrevibacter sp.]